MSEFIAVARYAIGLMPPDNRFTETDAKLILEHKDRFLAWEDELVSQFYNALFDHQPTKDVFHQGERPDREQTLREWWRRSVATPIDDQYFAWMAMVGLVHVVRKVENPMMLAMCNFVASFVAKKTENEADGRLLAGAFARLALTVGAVITQGFDSYRAKALENVVGMPPDLLKRLTQVEAESLLAQARAKA
ncbi:MAG: protoglobin domain-containing protein [Deinococcales bacterium]